MAQKNLRSAMASKQIKKIKKCIQVAEIASGSPLKADKNDPVFQDIKKAKSMFVELYYGVNQDFRDIKLRPVQKDGEAKPAAVDNRRKSLRAVSMRVTLPTNADTSAAQKNPYVCCRYAKETYIRSAFSNDRAAMNEALVFLVDNSTIYDFNGILEASTYADECGITGEQESAAKAKLDDLQKTRTAQADVYSKLCRSLQSRNAAEVSKPLAVASKLQLESHIIEVAKASFVVMQLCEEKKKLFDAVAAVDAANVANCAKAIVDAQSHPIERECMVDARLQLYRMRLANNEPTNPKSDLEAEPFSFTQEDIKGAFMDAMQSGSSGKESVTAVENLQRQNAEKLLSSAMNVQMEELDNLRHAITIAKARDVDESKVVDAERAVTEMVEDIAEMCNTSKILTDAMNLSNASQIEATLGKADDIEIDNKLVSEAQVIHEALMYISARNKIMTKLSDGVKMRNKQSLAKYLEQSMQLGIQGPAIEAAKEFYSVLQMRLEAEHNGDTVAAEKLKEQMQTVGNMAKAVLELRKIKPNRQHTVSITEEDEDANDTLDAEDDDEVVAELSPMRRKSRAAFRNIGEASEDDIHKVFCVYGLKSKECYEEGVGDRTINTMQFSTMWRMITGVKGNLFKEMQMFKKFDVANKGALTCDDFVEGWATIAADKDSEAQKLLRRVKEIASKA
jgi:hypothetical protein